MKNLGTKWWVIFILGIIFGLVGPISPIMIYSYLTMDTFREIEFYKDENLKMIPGVMGENEYIKVEMVSFESGNIQSPGSSMILNLTNKTSKEINVNSEYVTINGYSLNSSVLYQDLQPNESVEAILYINDNLLDFGIEKIVEMTMGINISYDNDKNEKNIYIIVLL